LKSEAELPLPQLGRGAAQHPASDSFDEMIRHSTRAARKAGLLDTSQTVIITGGTPLQVAGKTNFIKVERID
jgi:pyruvate kinase